ncbi:hypothetical protein Plim_1961 [Planctopirus limnophila DSM 3776]|uniref:Uncharacterized protein n=1 Tax=Planctopirus limnophila (strain ATCC 43296 / DSM 3776 / IFAM 1008 / Mu 290) TaxID=521674 RepID=D5SXV4_PLAL2|nr:hypothetical protein Plim_1961 [Planctopirus limnophila DSM 3776]
MFSCNHFPKMCKDRTSLTEMPFQWPAAHLNESEEYFPTLDTTLTTSHACYARNGYDVCVSYDRTS